MKRSASDYHLRLEVLKEASIDYRFLLSRGYNRELSLKFIGDKYGLSKAERMALYRAVFSKEEALVRMSKLSPPNRLIDRVVSIDGFNVLMTVKAALLRFPLLLCDDGFVRDLLSVFERIKVDMVIHIALELLIQVLLKYTPKRVFLFFDANVSKSGEFAAHVRKRLASVGLSGYARAVRKADIMTMTQCDTVASSDSVIILNSRHVIDLGGYIAKLVAPELIIRLPYEPLAQRSGS